MDRNAKILAKITKSMKILEIGPSLRPIASKKEFSDVFTLDHASQEDLISKYQKQGLNTDLIEPVDFIWNSGSMHESIPEAMHGTFDAVIASHVFEHVPDPIRFLQSIGLLLKADGILSIANPDKRFCFDFLKPVTTTGDMVEAYEEKHRRHSARALFEQLFDSVSSDGQLVWADWVPTGEIRFVVKDFSYEARLTQPEGSEYIDCHAWYFTPSSFDLIVLELNALGLIPFEIGLSYPSWGCEFFRTMTKSKPSNHEANSLAHARLHLHQKICDELRTQFDSWRPLNPT